MADNIKIVISAEDQASGPINNVASALGKASGGFSTVQAGLITLNQALELARKAWEALKIVVDAAITVAVATDNFVKLELALRTLTGSSVAAKAGMAWIVNFAQTAPVDIGTVSKAFIQLKAAGIDPTTGSMRALLDATLASGGGTEQFKRAIVAVQQMAGKGVISMEELRQQLAEAIPSATRIMAQELGLSLPALFDKITRGALTANEGLTALFRGLEKTYGGFAASQMNTYSGQVAILMTNWQLLLAEMGKHGIYDLVISSLQKINAFVKGLADESERTRLLGEVLKLGTGGMNLLSAAAVQGYVSLEKLREIHAELTYDMVLERREAEKGSAQIIADNVLRDVQDKNAQRLAAALATVGTAWERERIAVVAASQAMQDMQDIWLDLHDSWVDWGKLINVTIPALDDVVSNMQRTEEEAQRLAAALATVGTAWERERIAVGLQEVTELLAGATVQVGLFQFKLKDLIGAENFLQLAKTLTKFSTDLAEAFGASSGQAQGLAAGIAGGLLGAFQWFIGELGGAVFGGFTDRLKQIFGAIGDLFNVMWAGFQPLTTSIVDILKSLKPTFEVLAVILKAAAEPIRLIAEALKFLSPVLQALLAFYIAIWVLENLKLIYEFVVNTIALGMNTAALIATSPVLLAVITALGAAGGTFLLAVAAMYAFKAVFDANRIGIKAAIDNFGNFLKETLSTFSKNLDALFKPLTEAMDNLADVIDDLTGGGGNTGVRLPGAGPPGGGGTAPPDWGGGEQPPPDEAPPAMASTGGGMQLTVNIQESVDSRNTTAAVLRAVEELVATGRLRLA